MEYKNPILNQLAATCRRLKDVDRGCAEYTMKILDSYGPLQEADKPEEVLEHEKISYERRRLWGNDYHKDRPTILSYYKLCDIVRHENKARFEWLRKCKLILRGDPVAVLKITEKLKEYQPKENNNHVPPASQERYK